MPAALARVVVAFERGFAFAGLLRAVTVTGPPGVPGPFVQLARLEPGAGFAVPVDVSADAGAHAAVFVSVSSSSSWKQPTYGGCTSSNATRSSPSGSTRRTTPTPHEARAR